MLHAALSSAQWCQRLVGFAAVLGNRSNHVRLQNLRQNAKSTKMKEHGDIYTAVMSAYDAMEPGNMTHKNSTCEKERREKA